MTQMNSTVRNKGSNPGIKQFSNGVHVYIFPSRSQEHIKILVDQTIFDK